MLIKNGDIVLRTIHGSVFLIDISDNYSGDKCSLYEINETGKFLWENIDERGTIEGLVSALQEVIVDEVPHEVLFNDVKAYVESLIERKFLFGETANG